jgi:hypothetical protein
MHAHLNGTAGILVQPGRLGLAVQRASVEEGLGNIQLRCAGAREAIA